MSRVYLISGANRGLGLGLTRQLVTENPENIVFAGTREVNSKRSADLEALAKENDRVKVVQLDVTSYDSCKAAVAEIEKTVGRLDTVIANSGVNPNIAPILEMPLEDWKTTWSVNTLGAVHTFYAAADLLLKSKDPHFALFSSAGAILTNYMNGNFAPYASSKVAANMFVRSLDAEIPNLTAYGIHPGVVDSEMGALTVEKLGSQIGLTAAQFSPEESARRVLIVIASATREKYGGKPVDATPDDGPSILPF